MHTIYGHISYKNLSKKYLETEYYIDSIDLITEKFTYECPECNALFYPKQILKNPKIILDEGPLYRMLVDITYLEENILKIKLNINISSIQ